MIFPHSCPEEFLTVSVQSAPRTPLAMGSTRSKGNAPCSNFSRASSCTSPCNCIEPWSAFVSSPQPAFSDPRAVSLFLLTGVENLFLWIDFSVLHCGGFLPKFLSCLPAVCADADISSSSSLIFSACSFANTRVLSVWQFLVFPAVLHLTAEVW